jgi:DNA-binding MarR family transcriptional regulator
MSQSDFNLTFQNQNTESKIVAALERIAQAFRVLLWQECKEYALSPIQVQVLIFLLHHSAAKRKVSYLADEFNMTKATVSDAVKSLEQKKLIRKTGEQDDNRSYIIELTNKGKAIARKTSLFTRHLHTPVTKMNDDDKETLLLSLMQIINHLVEQEIITIQRMCFTCMHYRATQEGQRHFCRLLNKKLVPADLRIDCPEHQTAEA